MADPRPPLSSVDAVREELRRLGYLDSGLDRFVLGGPASDSRLRASLRATLRLSLVGGVVFGVAATLAAAGLYTRLLREPQDLVVLALYLVLAFAALTAVVVLVGGVLAAWAHRRERRPGPNLARNTGYAVALLAAFYVALWWRAHLAGSPVVGQAAAVLVALALALVLGRFASLAAVSVLSAAGGGELAQARLSQWRLLTLVLGALAVFGAVVGAFAWSSAGAAPGPDWAVVPTGLRVRVLGVDGLERHMAEQMMERGELPALAALAGSGARAALVAEPEQVPAIVWTTIATGRGPEAHGIRSAEERRVAGLRTTVGLAAGRSPFASALGTATDLLRLTRPQPPSAALRSVKTFWNVASEKGLRVGVVNWWASWPADPVNGYLVSDRALLKIEKGGVLDREVYPAAAFEQLRPLAGAPGPDRARHIDRFHVAAAALLRDDAPPDLEVAYLPGLDIVTMQQLGEAATSNLAALDSKLAAVRQHYRFVDGLIGEAVSKTGPSDVLVLVGDPGRLARAGAQGASAPQGLLLLAGGPVVHADIGGASERDVAPTLLYLLGIPHSAELSGRVLQQAFTEAFRREHPQRSVGSYGRRPTSPAESPFDRDVLEELKALGYIQ